MGWWVGGGVLKLSRRLPCYSATVYTLQRKMCNHYIMGKVGVRGGGGGLEHFRGKRHGEGGGWRDSHSGFALSVPVAEEAVKFWGGTKREQCVAVYIHNIYVCAGQKSWGGTCPLCPPGSSAYEYSQQQDHHDTQVLCIQFQKKMCSCCMQ